MGSRRGHGEGSIYKRDDGVWCASVNLGYSGGERRRKVFYGKTRREVTEKLKVALRDQQQRLPVTTERQTLRQFLERWLSASVKPSVKVKTYEGYESIVQRTRGNAYRQATASQGDVAGSPTAVQ
jgi:integrase